MTAKLPHKAWALVVFGLAMLVRTWALPFTVLGWVLGVIVQGFLLGWSFVFDDPMLGWAVRLNDAHRRKHASKARVVTNDPDEQLMDELDMLRSDDDEDSDDD